MKIRASARVADGRLTSRGLSNSDSPDAGREQNRFPPAPGKSTILYGPSRAPPSGLAASAAGDFELDLTRVLVTSTRSDSLQTPGDRSSKGHLHPEADVPPVHDRQRREPGVARRDRAVGLIDREH